MEITDHKSESCVYIVSNIFFLCCVGLLLLFFFHCACLCLWLSVDLEFGTAENYSA